MIRQEEWLAGMGALLADRSRSTMLLLLMDGRAYTATELSRAAAIAAPTASHHLERLESAGLIVRVQQGRHRYFRIANDDVAGLIEQTLATHAGLRPAAPGTSCPATLRTARRCYDHLAGELGVRLLSAGLQHGMFRVQGENVVATPAATPLLAALDPVLIDSAGRFCMDWSERRFHLAGPLAAGLLRGMQARRWFLAGEGRQLVLTEEGGRQFRRWFAG